jgi:hypothetical protein
LAGLHFAFIPGRSVAALRAVSSAVLPTIFVFAMISAALSQAPPAFVRIADDRGGNIGAYWSRYIALRDSGQQVVIDGACSSACTMVLGIVPYNRICITANAVLGFHAAWRSDFLGLKVVNEPATQTLWQLYPPAIRQWIARNGGLSTEMKYLSGPELHAIYRDCR